MSEFKQYRRKQIAELRPYVPGENLDEAETKPLHYGLRCAPPTVVSISVADREAGSPKPGDMIGRNPENHADQWLVAAKYFAANFEPVEDTEKPDLLKEIERLLNKHSRENASNTPDFILAQFTLTCLAAFEAASRDRERWYGRFLTPAGPVTAGDFGGEKLRATNIEEP